MGLIDNKHYTVQTKEAARVQAKSQEKIAKLQVKQAEKQAKRELIREKKQNQEGVYKKLGPFTIKTWIIIAIIIGIGIFMLVEQIRGNL